MRCVFCSHEDTRVVDKRDSESITRRRRECLKCAKRFTTYERAEISLTVVKKDGSKEAFSHEKLKSGAMKACINRPVSEAQIDEMIDDVEAKLISAGPEIASKAVGELVMKKLKKLDKVAYLRFVSVYRSFDDIAAFEKEVRMLKAEK